jgi:hypothetical protein
MANRYSAGPAGTVRTKRSADRALDAKGVALGGQRIESPAVAHP